MRNAVTTFATGVLAVSAFCALQETHAGFNLTGLRDFDFLFGEWRIQHRVLRPADGRKWVEFDGTCPDRPHQCPLNGDQPRRRG